MQQLYMLQLHQEILGVFGELNGIPLLENGPLKLIPENIWQDVMDVLVVELIQISLLFIKQIHRTHGQALMSLANDYDSLSRLSNSLYLIYNYNLIVSKQLNKNDIKNVRSFRLELIFIILLKYLY